MPEIKMMGINRTDVVLAEVDTVVLPIVFHIVHTGAGEETNISDEQVMSQLDVLNEEFADSKIQFCMASRDPDGNPTNGITRYDYSWNEEYMLNGVSNGQFVNSGVPHEELEELAGCWNPSEYINYYTVSEINGNDGFNGVQGFAYLGPTGDCRDGIICLYNVTGNVGTLKPGRELGFTGVHEMGHHLTLWHTFSNSNDCVETNCETQGDQVCDTPPTLTNYSCDVSFGDCPDALTENFMDYTPETCRESFTVGQAERMHNCLQTSRAGLVNNLSCVPVVDYDATPLTAYYQQTWCTTHQDIWIDVVNQGTLPLDLVEVQLYVNGNQYVEYLYDVPTGTHEVMFEHVYVDGAQMFEVQVVNALDEFPDNDYAWWPIETVPGDLMNITVGTDFWANETDWVLYDGAGEIVLGDGDYPSGTATYEYEVCLYTDCYTIEITDTNGDGFCSFDFGDDGCDFGGEGITGVVGVDTLFATGWGAEFAVWDSTFCVEIDPCPLDFDGNGTIGNGDLLMVVGEYGCMDDCETDPNNDGIISVLDLIYFLQFVGNDCPPELDFSPGLVKDLIISDSKIIPFGAPKVYDIAGRQIDVPVENLASGVYILKWKNVTKKVFVQ